MMTMSAEGEERRREEGCHGGHKDGVVCEKEEEKEAAY